MRGEYLIDSGFNKFINYWSTSSKQQFKIMYAIKQFTGTNGKYYYCTFISDNSSYSSISDYSYYDTVHDRTITWAMLKCKCKCNPRRTELRSLQNMEQYHILPRGRWSIKELLAPSADVFSSGIPKIGWWYCPTRRKPKAECRLLLWPRTKFKTRKGRKLEPGYHAAFTYRKPTSEQWQRRKRSAATMSNTPRFRCTAKVPSKYRYSTTKMYPTPSIIKSTQS